MQTDLQTATRLLFIITISLLKRDSDFVVCVLFVPIWATFTDLY